MRASGSPSTTLSPSHPIRRTNGRWRSHGPLTHPKAPCCTSPVSTACGRMVWTGTRKPWERRMRCSRTQKIRENPSSAPSSPSSVCVRSIILKVRRADGHLFISVIAYQAIQVLRTRRTQTGLTASWTTIRNALRTLPRITTAFARPDGRRLHVRNTALPNADQAAIYQAMPIAPPARNPAPRLSSESA